jgi:hypothetical protein
VCDLEVMGAPSILSIIRKVAVLAFFVYYESRKRELKTKPIHEIHNECRCDERLKTKTEKSTRLTYTGLLGELEHLKIKTRLIVIDTPSTVKLTRKAAAFERVLQTFAFRMTEKAAR